MEETKSLKTRVNKTALLLRYMKILIPLMAVIMAACLIALPAGAGVFAAAVTAFCFIIALVLVVSGSGSTTLECFAADGYHGPRVYVRTKSRSFEVSGIGADDCLIRQTGRQKAADRGDVTFREENIHLQEVDGVSELEAFMKAHFTKA